MKKETALLVLGAIALSAFLSLTAKTGTDDRAVNLIGDITEGGYTPWAEHIWAPPESWMETLLFSLQAAIGAFVFGYTLHQIKGHDKREDNRRKGCCNEPPSNP
ncbi:MAG: hypothetical protein D6733_01885 [Methanobacteriota archaeon]|nr:MAG: hypothetical protein D6733_01885 [Euryarchaeota archaeon]